MDLRYLTGATLAVCMTSAGLGHGAETGSITLRSPAFAEGARIPSRCTCDGEDLSPPLTWGTLPSGTKSLALIVEDPDAPRGTWTHWVLYNVPPAAAGLSERAGSGGALPQGAQEGINDFKKIGYGGPCPPGGSEHRYFFRLYALDAPLKLQDGAQRKMVEEAMQGHVIAQGALMGRYSRGK